MVSPRVHVTTMKRGAAAARAEFGRKRRDAAGVSSERLTGLGEQAFVRLKTSTQVVNRREAILVYRVGGQVVEVTFGGLSTVPSTAGPDSGTTALSDERVLNPVKDIARQLAARTAGK
ncbi:hypothetical protein GCM10009733_092010 [Nonomuraea maheshkhaliensis]|uniref:Uncharacterized protein n=2 Tax=Nonomuraea maheshkhaliensis TaxID=419590 RepID=A0ABN2H2G3_9ACTN